MFSPLCFLACIVIWPGVDVAFQRFLLMLLRLFFPAFFDIDSSITQFKKDVSDLKKVKAELVSSKIKSLENAIPTTVG